MVGVASQGQIDQQLVTQNDHIVKHMLEIREAHALIQTKDYSHVFRKKSRLDLIRLSCIVVGIEFAYAAETAFVSPLLLQIGIEHKNMTMVWGLSPILGMLLGPFLGSFSDRCRLNLGRRRPIIILLSTGIIIGLLLVPFGKNLGVLLGDTEAVVDETSHIAGSCDLRIYDKCDFKYAQILTILGTILLDFNADTCQGPSRSYLLDVCIPEDHAKALSTFTIMAGLGGTFGYALGGINWSETQLGLLLGGNVPTVFTIVLIIFFTCFLITVTSFREIPLPQIEKDDLLRPLSAIAIKKEILKSQDTIYYIKESAAVETVERNNDQCSERCDIAINSSVKQIETDQKINPKIEIDDEDFTPIPLLKYLKSVVVMPKSLRILCLTNLFSWMSHVCYCLYFTDFVGEAVFRGDPSAAAGIDKNLLYEEGVRFGCWGLSIYAFSCSVYSMGIEKLLKVFSLKLVYIGGMLAYAAGMTILALWPTRGGVLAFSTTAGIIYATLFTIPYILIARYHARGCFKMKRGLGTDVAIVSSMVFVAQLIVSLSIGSLLVWSNSTSAVLYAASGFSLCAATSALFVLYVD